MPEIPFAHQWTIAENELVPWKESINGRLFSGSVCNIPEFEYYLGIYPNGDTYHRRGETWIFLIVKFKNVKKVEADWTITIESANFSRTIHYEESYCHGRCICTTVEFFDPEKKFIVDGKFTLNVYGTFKFENNIPVAIAENQQKWEGSELGDELWIDNETKDFTIITGDGKEIKVDKFILSRSEFFNDLLTTCSNESSLEIGDFPSNVVETAVRIIYDCNFTSSLSIDELMPLQQSFDKFQLPALKAKVEPLLISQISASTVVRLVNCSILTNSQRLKNSCIEFLMTSFESKAPLSDIDKLNKNIALLILQNSLRNNVSTEQAVIQEQQKWIGGELGDEFWKKDDTKDFAIITSDGNEIKVHKFILLRRSEFFKKYLNKHPNAFNLEIDGFPFNVVETGIKIIYNCNFTTKLSIGESMLLFEFFDQYELPAFKAKVEPLLISQISPSNVVRLTNYSVQTNSPKLQQKCMEFLMAAFESKTALADIGILNKDIALKILQNSLYSTLSSL